MAEDKGAEKRAGHARAAKTKGSKETPSRKGRAKSVKSDARSAAQSTKDATARFDAKPKPKASSKKDAIIALLSRKSGANIEEMCAATGWQAHSVRGFLSGTVGRKLGLKLASSTDTLGIRRYAIKR